jgi:hypothetical protein
MPSWQLWERGSVLKSIEVAQPLLASWNSNTDPAQIRLQAYLDDLQARLGVLPFARTDLYLNMDIDVRDPVRLSRHHDLENYLTPVVACLGAGRFSYVRATKRVGGGSQVSVGLAAPANTTIDGWNYFACAAGAGAQTPRWKTDLRHALVESNPPPLPPGPVAVQLAWRCSRQRNWVGLWKPTGDAMGPVLGEPRPDKPYNPADDRIVTLALHRNIDDTIGHDVNVGMWWRSESL